MAAGSVAAGGLYMQSEFNQLKNKKLQEFGLQVDDDSPAAGKVSNKKKKILPKMAKVRKLRDRYVTQTQRRRSTPDNHRLDQRILLQPYTLEKLLETPAVSQTDLNIKLDEDGLYKDQNGVAHLDEDEECDESADYFFTGDLRRKSDNAEIINVSGTLFLVDFSVFRAYPETLLGSDRMQDFYRSSREEYFLERQKHIFSSVMRFYTNDEELNCPPCIPKYVFESELEFYGLAPYYHKVSSTPVADLKQYKAKSRREEILLHIEFPGYSRLATAYAIFDLAMIIVSTIILVLESVEELTEYPLFAKICVIVEIFVNVYFTVQTILLISVYPNRRLYFSSVTNWIDLISIMPFYLKIIAKEYLNQVGGFRVLRLIRLLRILKLFRHSPGSQNMIQFLITSIPEIVLLLLMWSIGVLMFGPLLYFVEQDGEVFSSAFSGMWFCVVTIGTVGYGDIVPKTESGKVLAAFYTILNLTIMTIPISIIITKFNKSMKKGG